MSNRTSAPLLFLAFILVGCSADSDGPAPGSLTASPTPQPVFTSESQIYSAVLHRLVLTDHPFGDGFPSPFKAVYIIENRSSGISDLFFLDAGGAPLEQLLKSEIEEMSDGLPPVEFIDQSDQVADPARQGATGVQNDGAVVGLSAIVERTEGIVEVGAGYWCGVDCGYGSTYVVEEMNGRWQVTDVILGSVVVS